MGQAAKKQAGSQRQKIRQAEQDRADRSVVGHMRPLAERERQAPGIVAQEAEYRGATNHRVLTPIEIYRERGQISTRQFNAGAALYRDWSAGICGVNDRDGSGSGGAIVGMSEAQLMALESFNGALKRLDRRQRELVLDVCCHESTIAVLARVRAEQAEDVMKRLRAALALLGDAYGMPSEATTETIRTTVRMSITYQQVPNGTFEISAINGVSVAIVADTEIEAFKAAQEWANTWVKRRLGIVSARESRA